MTVTEISNIIIVPPIKQITDFVNRIFNIIPFSVKCKHIINDFGNSVTMPKNGVIDMSNLYEIIEKLCEAESITITEMCRRANVPRGNLSDLLNNRQKSLSPKNLKKIADYFNVTIDYLLTGIKKEPVTASDELAPFIPKGEPNEFVFSPDGENRPMSMMVFQRKWANFQKATGITCTAHQLRHSFATMLYDADVDVKQAQDILGHTTEAMTMDVYTKISERKRKSAADNLNAFIKSKHSNDTADAAEH